MITVEFLGPVKALTGKAKGEYQIGDSITVTDLLELLAASHGEAFRKEISRTTGEGSLFYQILINGSHIFSLEGMDTLIKRGDHVLFSIPLFGG